MCSIRHASGLLALIAALALQAQGPAVSLPPATPSPGSYHPPKLTLEALTEADQDFQQHFFSLLQTGDKAAFRAYIEGRAKNGDLLAEFMLGEQYIPPECPFAKMQAAQNLCEAEKSSRPNPLGIDPSFADAISWLSKASDQGSGDASEILAQLIDRVIASGDATAHTQTEVDHYTRLRAPRVLTIRRTRSHAIRSIPITPACFRLANMAQTKASPTPSWPSYAASA
jgi:hypothetical protein